jgi:hypothetical protein
VLVGEGQRRPGFARAPAEVAGEHADQHVRTDAVFQPAEDQAQVQLVDLMRRKSRSAYLRFLQAVTTAGAGQLAFGDGGAQHAEPVERGFLSDPGLLRATARLVSVIVTAKGLPALYLLITLPTATPISAAPVSLPAARG